MKSKHAFNWDRHNIAHIARHDVVPAEVEEVFANIPIHIETQLDGRSGEPRHLEIGETDANRVLYVVWTPRENLIRVVTAWAVGRAASAAYRRRRREESNVEKNDQKAN